MNFTFNHNNLNVLDLENRWIFTRKRLVLKLFAKKKLLTEVLSLHS